MKYQTKLIPGLALAASLLGWTAAPAATVDLLQKYPTSLTAGLLDRGQARAWQFAAADIFRLSRFSFAVGEQLKVECGPADLGIGHCADGAVWAIVAPREGGKLTRAGGGEAENIAHIWLRFHPKEINRLFPPATVSAEGAAGLAGALRTIANAKMNASYHAGARAMIPEPKDMTVDVDTKNGPRRFFMVDTQARTAQYVSFFERQSVRVALTPGQPGPAKETAEAGAAPNIVATSPAIGATDVDPALTEITVTFDQDMSGGFSWTGGGPEFPPSPEGQRAQWRDPRTCVLPVKLEPGHHYRVGINAPSFKNFRSTAGVPVEPSAIYFTTKSGAGGAPKIVSISPLNGARDVSPGLKELRVTFNVPMAEGFSWCGDGPQFPTIPDGKKPYWTDDHKTCVLPVELKPGSEYRLGLNSRSAQNFRSASGTPLVPVIYTFKTSEK